MSVGDFLFSGTTPQSFLTPSTSTQTLPDWYQDASKSLIQDASQYAAAAQPVYQGPRLADLNPTQQQAFTQTQNASQLGMPQNQQALNTEQKISQGFDPNQFNQYRSSYTQNVDDAIARLGVRNLQESILPGVQDQFIQAGQFGSQQQGNVMNKAIRDTNESILNQQASTEQQSQQNAMSNYLTGQQTANQAANNEVSGAQTQQNMGLAGANALYNTGAIQQNQSQQGLNVAYNDFLNQSQQPLQNIGLLSAVMNHQQLPTTQTQYTPQIIGPQQSQSTGSDSLAQLLGQLGNLNTSGQNTNSPSPGAYLAKGGQYKGYAKGGAVASPPVDDGQSYVDQQNARLRAMVLKAPILNKGDPEQYPANMFTKSMVTDLMQDPTYNASVNALQRDASSPQQGTGYGATYQAPLPMSYQPTNLEQSSITRPNYGASTLTQLLAALGNGQQTSVKPAFAGGGAMTPDMVIAENNLPNVSPGYAPSPEPSGNPEALLASLGSQYASDPTVANAAAASPAPQATIPSDQSFASPISSIMAMRMPHIEQSLSLLGQLASQAPQLQQQAQGARTDYADQLKQLTQQYLKSQTDMMPYLNQPYTGLSNPQAVIDSGDTYAKLFPSDPSAKSAALIAHVIADPDATQMANRQGYDQAVLKLSDLANKAGMSANVDNATDAEKQLDTYAQQSGMGTSGASGEKERALAIVATLDQNIAQLKGQQSSAPPEQQTQLTQQINALQQQRDNYQSIVAPKMLEPGIKDQEAQLTSANKSADTANTKINSTRDKVTQLMTILPSVPDEFFGAGNANSALSALRKYTEFSPEDRDSINAAQAVLTQSIPSYTRQFSRSNVAEINLAKQAQEGFDGTKDGMLGRLQYANGWTYEEGVKNNFIQGLVRDSGGKISPSQASEAYAQLEQKLPDDANIHILKDPKASQPFTPDNINDAGTIANEAENKLQTLMDMAHQNYHISNSPMPKGAPTNSAASNAPSDTPEDAVSALIRRRMSGQ